MSLVRLVLRNVVHAGARSVAVAFGAALIAAFALLSAMVVAGAQQDLAESIDRLGADIVVLPWGTPLEGLPVEHLARVATSGRLPRSDVSQIGGVSGVEAVSPQLHLATLNGSRYASSPEAYIVAFEPATDFALQPWIEPAVYRQLPLDYAVVGARILDTGGSARIPFDGYHLRIAGQLPVTGTDLDETIFVSFDTAARLIDKARDGPNQLSDISPQVVSTALVRVKHGEDVREVAARIMDAVPGSLAIASARMLQSQRSQLFGLLITVRVVAVMIWVLAVTFIGLVFAMTVNSRRQQIGVLRALGSPQLFVVRWLIAEGALLGVAGGVCGVVLAAVLGLVLLRANDGLDLPLAVPTFSGLAGAGLVALLLAVGSVTVAALVPVLRISRAEPARTMRE